MAPTEIGGFNETEAAAILAPISVCRLIPFDASRYSRALADWYQGFMLRCQYASLVIDTFLAYVIRSALAKRGLMTRRAVTLTMGSVVCSL